MSMLPRRGRHLAALGATAALAAGLLVVAPQAAQAAGDIGFEGPVQSTATGTFGSLPTAATASRGQHKVWYAGGTWWAALPNVGSTGTSIHKMVNRESDTPSWADTNVVIDSRDGTSSDSIYNAGAGKLFIASHVVVDRNTSPNPAGVANNDVTLTRYSLVDGGWVKDEGWPVVILANRALPAVSIAQMSDGKIMAVFTKDAGPYAANTTTSANGVNPPVFTGAFKIQWTQNKLLFPDLAGATTLTGDDSAVISSADGFVTIVFSNQNAGYEGYYVARHRVGDVYGTGNFFGTKLALDVSGAFSAGPQMSLVTDPTSSTTSPVYLTLRTNLDSTSGGRTPVDSDPLIKVVKIQPRLGGAALTSLNTGYVSTKDDITLRTVADRGSRPVLSIDNTRRSLDVFYAAPETPATPGLQPSNHTGVIYRQSLPLDGTFAQSDAAIVMQDDASSSGNTANKPDGMSHPTTTAQILNASMGTVVLATDTYAADLNAPTLSLTRKYWHADLFRATSANFVAQIPSAGNAQGLIVDFTDTSLGRPTSWDWDFGDGATSTSQNPTHTYGAGGSKSVTLTVTNANGSETTVTKTVVVGAVPTANFSTSLPNKQKLLLQIKDTSTGAPDSLQYNFGDGTAPVTVSTPGGLTRHTYAKAGRYTVTLTATNGVGSSAVKSLSVVVNATPSTISKPTRTVPTGRKVVVAWKVPNNRGLTIDKYQVTCRAVGSTRSVYLSAKDSLLSLGKARTATVTLLTAGKTYTCVVKAHNGRGWNLPSSPSTSFKARA